MASLQILLQIIAIVLSTFILEDAATLIVAIEAQEHAITIKTALIGLYCGIILGDIGLYGIGFLARKWPFFRNWVHISHDTPQRTWMAQHLFRLVFGARFLPGTRLPLYTTCGFLALPLKIFSSAVVLATLIWTSSFFFLAYRLGRVISQYLGAWRWLGLLGLILSILLMLHFFSSMLQKKNG